MQKRIDNKNVDKILPLTPMQEGMLFYYLKDGEGNNYYLEQLSLEIEGDIDLSMVKEAWKYVVEANEMLRTIFRWEKLDTPVQIILKKYDIPIRTYDISELDNHCHEEKIEEIKIEDKKNKLDIQIEPFRITLIKRSDRRLVMIITNHHILYDGWSNGIILKEFLQAYHDLSKGIEPELSKKNSFKEFIKWLNSQNKEEEQDYWTRYLAGFEDKTILPQGFSVPEKGGLEKEQLILNRDMTDEVKKFVKENELTLAALFYSIWGLLLQRYNASHDVIFGTTVSGRNVELTGIEEMIGLFINTVPLRMKTNPDKTLLSIIRDLNGDLNERSRYEHVPLTEIQSLSKLESREALFESLMVIENYPLDKELNQNKGLNIKSYSMSESTNYDLTLLLELRDQLSIQFEYNTLKLDSQIVKQMAVHFSNILTNILSNPHQTLSELEMISQRKKSQLIDDFNDTASDYPADKTLSQLFEEQVAKKLDKEAIVYQGDSLTYRELNRRANRLALTLRKKGVKADSLVAIMVERSFDMIVGILAILKAGGAYIPITPEYPAERISYILEDSQAEMILTLDSYLDKLDFDGQILDLAEKRNYSTNKENLEHINSPTDLAYVIYTSGSTGRPKGVLVQHQSVVNILTNLEQDYPLGENDTYLLKTTFTFDVSVTELFGWFIGEGRLAILPPGGEKDVSTMVEAIDYHNVTHINFVPSMLNIFLDEMGSEEEKKLESLKYIIVAGEAFSQDLARKSAQLLKDKRVENIYGPTETTIYVTRYSLNNLTEERRVPIGKPLNNVQAYIVDGQGNLLPIGVAGELCISGDCLTRGYLDRDELTAEKFVDNPFASGQRMYRTGDLVRWLPDGNIEFLGRIDHQVKIRGFRIEPGEIEKEILNHPSINDIVVMDREDQYQSKYLCAYLVLKDESREEFTTDQLREFLLDRLPEYMVPSYFVQLDQLPLNTSGKVDRKSLPEPEVGLDDREYQPPRDELEEELAQIWQEILDIGQVGIDDNFFELGGHSLTATRLVSKIYKIFQIRISLDEIFDRPTIREIAQYIKESNLKTIYHSIEKVEEADYYQISPAQKRIYVMQQLDMGSTVYNMPGIWEVEGELQLSKMRNVVEQLINRHESLRTSFDKVEDQLVQFINDNVEFTIEYFEQDKRVIDEIIAQFIRPFDLSQAPLFRIGIIELESERQLLMFDIHHIISDGISLGILIDEFFKLYHGEELEEMDLQYKDYAGWQRNLMEEGMIKEQKEYWLDRFSGQISVLDLPTDYDRGRKQGFEGESIDFKFDPVLVRKLEKLARTTGTTTYMILLSGLNILLSRYTGQEDIIIGSPTAGRSHPDLEKVIGMFVNTLAMRNRPNGNKRYDQFLSEVKKNVLSAYQNQDYQFEDLISNLDIDRNINRNPLFDVMLSMQTMLESLETEDISLKPYPVDKGISKFDFSIAVEQGEEEIKLELNYNTGLFKRATMERMLTHFEHILEVVAENPAIELKQVKMLRKEEREQVLYKFNETDGDYQIEKTLHTIFEEQVAKTPDKVALISETGEMSYRKLNEKANSLARTLRERGVGTESIVGLMVERSPEMMVAILAILKAGGAYLPISPDYPEERIYYMLEDSDSQVVLTQTSYIGKLPSGLERLALEDEDNYADKIDNLEPISNANNLAYLIYTSGSTGRPKGVLVEHNSTINTIKHLQQEYPLDETDIILQSTVFTFDASVREIFWWFFNGASLYLLSHDGEKNPYHIVETIDEQDITVAKFVPVLLYEVLKATGELGRNKLDSLRILLVGGEALAKKQVDKYFDIFGKEGPRFVNVYGPSETTIHCTEYEIEGPIKRRYASIGQPITNDRVYILDKNLNPLPVGVPGDIYIAGQGVARGYINNPQLTFERFMEDIFVAGEMMYRSGDLGYWSEDGNLEFKGRVDYQVKVRGYRIELGEIEKHLLDYQGINEAVVIDVPDKEENKYLCGYLVAEEEVTITELREYLSNRLPDYMIPATFVQLEKMPLNKSGKIDRQALPDPEGNLELGNEYQPPRNKIEEKLVNIWQEILEVEQVGINDNFFELGGHSLKATILGSRIHRELDMELTLREIFQRPTIKEISEYIGDKTELAYQPIPNIPEKSYYPTSSAQKRTYMIQQFDPGSTGYNMPGALIIEGDLDLEQVGQACNQLLHRHETLRTSFETIDEQVIQQVNKEVDLELELIEESVQEIEELVEEFIRPFDLSQAPLFRVRIVNLAEERYLLVFDMHHIISDGTSMSILISEFIDLYQGQQLEELTVQYKDYADWQNKLLESDKLKSQEKYWLNRFSDQLPVLELPTDYPRPAVQSFEGDRFSYSLGQELTAELEKLATRTGTTLYMILLSAINILLSRYSGQEDIIVGSPIAGRNHPDLENIIGMFVNTLAMRNQPSGDMSYLQFLNQVKEKTLQAFENQDYQFEMLVEKLDLRRDMSRNPIFDVLFVMENMERTPLEIDDLAITTYNLENKTSKFDLSIYAEMEKELVLAFEYSTGLFKEETIARMSSHLNNILEGIVEDSDRRLNQIELLNKEERVKLLSEFNNTDTPYPENKTLNQIFEESVARTPDKVGLAYNDVELTYRQLDQRATGLATELRNKGVGPDDIVAVMTERCPEMMVAILAIHKAGGAYLPITPEYPRERIKYLLEDSGAELILTWNEYRDKIDFEGQVIDLDNDQNYSQIIDLERVNRPDNLAYIIYTSGSTGQPKGVMVEHQSAINILTNMEMDYPLEEGDTYLLKTTFTFDVSVTELFGWYFGKGRLAILSPGGEKNVKTIVNAIDDYQVTHINFVPSMFNIFLDELEDGTGRLDSVKYMFVAGEAFTKELVNKSRSKLDNIIVENIYGPTETTIYVTRYSIGEFNDDERLVPIGGPLNNVRAYVLDRYDNLLPVGVAGELCIAGDCLTRGYLNKENLTDAKFVNDPFNPEEKMYRTGDKVRWLDDGNLEYLGRIDNQVKIRGYRIEPGEIEGQLLEYSPVKEAAVIDRVANDGTRYLCAYTVLEEEIEELTAADFRGYLADKLPEYMVPAYFVQLDEMPLTQSGKLDRKALPEPQDNLVLGSEYEAPRNYIEEKLVQIWRDSLGIERIGINDNYFELGGHSLKATALISRIHQELEVKLPLNQIFKTPTIKAIANYLKNLDKTDYSAIEPIKEQEYYQTSSAQKRMYMLQQFDLESTSYNMSTVLKITGRLDLERVEEVFARLIERHETLRTSFVMKDDTIVQIVNQDIDFKIDYLDKKGGDTEEVIQNFIRPFNLAQAPLFRVGICSLSADEYLLICDLHHIISDGVSNTILIREFMELYQGQQLEDLRIQYKDYAYWQSQFIESPEIKEQEEYWLERFDDELPVLNLPTDYPRRPVKSMKGDQISYRLDKRLTVKLQKLAHRTGTTMYMVLLSGINILLSRYSRQDDIIIGSPIAGRPSPALEQVIGMFVNTLAMRNNPTGEKSYHQFLEEVKKNALDAYQNQEYQFEELIDRLDLARDMNRNPLFDVMFALQNMDQQELELEELTIKPHQHQQTTAKFDLTIFANQIDDDIDLTVEYSTQLFKRGTIESMISHLEKIFEEITAGEDLLLKDIELVTSEEKEKLLYEYNQTGTDYPVDKTIQQLFEEQVEINPQDIAVVYKDESLTYRELNDKANSLAYLLKERGIGEDELVGVMAHRSLEMIVGIMAIIKAGGAYLPLDPDYPTERIEYMLEDCSVNTILIQNEFDQGINFDGRLIHLLDDEIYQSERRNPEIAKHPSSLAYVIYTSGSTGQPKGVMVEEHSIVRLVKKTNYVQFERGDKILQTGTLAFDASTFEIWGSLLNGIQLHLGSKELILKAEEMARYLEDNQITTMFLTTSLFNMLAEEDAALFHPLRLLYIGGEAMSPRHANLVRRACPDLHFHNIYGPTENTTFSTYFKMEKEYNSNVPIGKPISNTTAYVVDQGFNLCPIGVYGELCLGGDGLARGYLNRPELTADKFVDNPFQACEKMYRTGDLVRWLPDGNIEFGGRMDHQVKIRGFRIEPGEIEKWLLKDETIKEVAVLARKDDQGNKYLVAYFVAEREIRVEEIRYYLADNLPDYMIPSYFIQLDEMPLNRNGKLERKSLPEPKGNIKTGAEYRAPENELEERLATIWSQILGLDRVGTNDNFFELGGHSLKATALSSKIHKELEVKVPLNQIFKEPTIKGISSYIESAATSDYLGIRRVEEQEYYQTSSAQRRMYMLQQFDTDSTGYNISTVLKISGRLELDKVKSIFQQLIRRHDSLRTSFEMRGDEVVQLVNYDVDFDIEYLEKEDEQAPEEIVKRFIRPFDLKESPLLRVGVVKLSKEEYLVVFDMHHIISDGTSMAVLVREFTHLYQGQQLAELNLQYKDYAHWQSQLLQSAEMQSQEKYWLEQFSGQLPILELPTDFPRPVTQSFEGDRYDYTLDPQLVEKLERLTSRTGTTMYMVLLSAINILLARYSGQEDIIIGSPIAGRNHSELENIIGMFVNTLAMRNRPTGNLTYLEFLDQVKEKALQAFENQDYQFEMLVEKLELKRDMSRNPIFDVMFVMENMDRSSLELEGLEIEPYDQKNTTSKFDLSFYGEEIDGQLVIGLEYSTKLFKRESIIRMSKHLTNILETIVENSDQELEKIDLLNQEERVQILSDFNDTDMPYLEDKTLNQIFEERVTEIPDKVGVVYDGQELTYRQLDKRANGLAAKLRQKGVGPDKIVALMTERCPGMMVAILAIHKAGGAYLPITPEYPRERIEYLLEDSGAELILTWNKYLDKLDFDGQVIDLDDEANYSEKLNRLDRVNRPDNLAYIIYTSGSTGKPKGVMVEHRSAVNILTNMEKDYPLEDGDTYLLKTTFTFDVSVTELFGWYFGKGRLAILSPGGEKNIRTIVDAIDNYQVTHLNFVPSMFNIFLDGIDKGMVSSLSSLKYLFIAGEVFTTELVSKCRKKLENIRVENIYGPTETTIYVTRYPIKDYDDERFVPIGSPLNNVRAYVLDKYDNLLPVGVPGELYIAGDCLTRGYLNKEELTSEKFVDDPFNPGEKMYRTGDKVRWLKDGNLEYLGRIDNQVKIRGYRIEPGELEGQLLDYPPVKEVAVVDRMDKDDTRYLCAYIILEEEREDLTAADFREYLADKLPEYMVPAYFVQLDEMPLTQSGKLDRKALPEPQTNLVLGSKYEAPRNQLEEKLVDIWRDSLGVENLGINDNYFELGGHSLKATALISRIHKELEVKISLNQIFKTPTIKAIAEYIKNASRTDYRAIEQIEEQEYYQTSSAQKRMFMLQQFDLESTGYNMPTVLKISGRLDLDRLEEVFAEIINRHETLRTHFTAKEGRVIQIVNRDIDFEIDCLDKNDQEIERIIQEYIKPFNLEKAPLLRVGICKLSTDEYLLICDMHHIISDGVSISILIREFSHIYQGQQLEELRIQYKDYANWQNEFLKSDNMKDQEEYWLDRFDGELPVLNLPTDYPRQPVRNLKGAQITYQLGQDLATRLEEMVQRTGATMYMVLLSGINILLSRYSQQDDIIIGSPVAGRPDPDLEQMIGMFVNTLAMRNNPTGDKSFLEFLEEVKENALAAFQNQDYQFEELIEKLDLNREMDRNPLFDVMFALQNIDQEPLELDELTISPYQYQQTTAKFDLTIFVNLADGINLNIEYSTQLFKTETIERIVTHLEKVLEEITAEPNILLKNIELITIEEKEKLLYEYNQTVTDYPADKTIQELFEEQVEHSPNEIAVVFKDKSLTYRKLNDKANSLAYLLKERGIEKEELVGIMAHPSVEMTVGIMAILKAGGSYLPLDPDYPAERLEYMLEDCSVDLILIQEKFSQDIDFNGSLINLLDDKTYRCEKNNPEIIKEPSSLAYVIYTSGSTGQPKGVMVEEQSVIRLVKKTNYVQFEPGDKILQTGTLAFDASTFEIWGSLLNGIQLHLGPKVLILKPEKMAKYLKDNQISTLFITTTLFNLMVEEDPALFQPLRMLYIGGETMSAKHANLVREACPGLKLHNIYGPTENTTFSTFLSIEKEYSYNVPIGKPISNTTAYVLDQYSNLAPIGVYGELCLGGDGVARGYLNNEELTAEKFVDNPYIMGELIYRTGDLVRILPDGNIEFAGRIDNQVKIRGFRIEPGEIEHNLQRYNRLKEVAVIAGDDEEGNKYLAAYLVSDGLITIEEVRSYLSENLPDYMIPDYFIQLDEMPLNQNGKIDRKALPEPDGRIVTGKDYQPPENEFEKRLAQIWSQVLGVEQIGVNDNFFDLGGHSLKGVKVVSAISDQLNIEVSLRDFFMNPTIRELAGSLEEEDNNIFQEIKPVGDQEYYDMSYAQKRLWYIYQLNPESTAYNLAHRQIMEDELDPDQIRSIFAQLVERHESLRTYFKVIDGRPVQIIGSADQLSFEFIDISSAEEKSAKREEIYQKIKNYNFDLTTEELFKVILVKVEDEKYDLITVQHHIITDGWSMNLLHQEFSQIYQAMKKGEKYHLPELEIQYRDYAAWQNQLLNDSTWNTKEKEFWSEQLEQPLPVLQLPRKNTQMDDKDASSAAYRFVIPEKILKDLKEMGIENNASLFIILLTGFNLFLSRITDQRDLIVGIPAAGRNHKNLENVIGFFVNTVILRTRLDLEESLEELISQVSNKTYSALEYQSYPLELIVEEMKIDYPEISVFFNMINLFEQEKEYLENTESYHIDQVQDVKFDIACYVTEYKNGIEVSCHYLTRLFEPEIIEYLMGDYQKMLSEICQKSDQKLAEYLGHKKQKKKKRRIIRRR